MDPIIFPGLAHANKLSIDAASGLGNYSSINASAILELSQRHTIQVMATVTSSISLVAALCAAFWFIMMQRNFRRDLVLLLILGGSWKSFWFMCFSAVTFARGAVHTSSPFCQVSGYCLQVGFEACDVAVFFMSMHMYYQIFPPSHSMLGHDGLYRVRKWVVAAWVIFPNLSAGLAFVNKKPAFMAQGAFCTIPLRPFWWRLGLFWIPRYLIWLYIVFVAVRIYRHVGHEFKVFGGEQASAPSFEIPGQSSIDRATKMDLERGASRKDSRAVGPTDEELKSDDADPVQVLANPSDGHAPSGQRFSIQEMLTTQDLDTDDTALPTPSLHKASVPRSASQISTEDFVKPPSGERRASAVSFASQQSCAQQSTVRALSPIAEGGRVPSTSGNSSAGPHNTANLAMERRRCAIQRQLRLLFIYPVVYMLLWMIPFVVNIMNYLDYFAQHPVYALQILQIFMLTIMTHVDVVVFCWRERPWRHIPGSDGTFLGSFLFWRYCFDYTWSHARRASTSPSLVPTEASLSDPLKEKSDDFAAPSAQHSIISSLRSSVHRMSTGPRHSHASSEHSTSSHSAVPQPRNFSGGSDRRFLESQMAHERLALERADYERKRRSLNEARSSVISNSTAQSSPGRREWFDRAEEELFRDDAEEED